MARESSATFAQAAEAVSEKGKGNPATVAQARIATVYQDLGLELKAKGEQTKARDERRDTNESKMALLASEARSDISAITGDLVRITHSLSGIRNNCDAIEDRLTKECITLADIVPIQKAISDTNVRFRSITLQADAFAHINAAIEARISALEAKLDDRVPTYPVPSPSQTPANHMDRVAPPAETASSAPPATTVVHSTHVPPPAENASSAPPATTVVHSTSPFAVVPAGNDPPATLKRGAEVLTPSVATEVQFGRVTIQGEPLAIAREAASRAPGVVTEADVLAAHFIEGSRGVLSITFSSREAAVAFAAAIGNGTNADFPGYHAVVIDAPPPAPDPSPFRPFRQGFSARRGGFNRFGGNMTSGW